MRPVKVGVGGPVGSGKTALVDTLCKRLRDTYSVAVITNDIYCAEDAEFLMRSGALPLERIRGDRPAGVRTPPSATTLPSIRKRWTKPMPPFLTSTC